MEKTVNDDVFGEMSYKHRWYKRQQINLFAKEWDVTVAAKAYSGKSITDDQRKSYTHFSENEAEMEKTVAEQLKEYVNSNLPELALHWTGARTVETAKDLAQMVTPQTLLFQQDGTTILLLDCVWDEEKGVAVKLYPEVAVGIQDLFI